MKSPWEHRLPTEMQGPSVGRHRWKAHGSQEGRPCVGRARHGCPHNCARCWGPPGTEWLSHMGAPGAEAAEALALGPPVGVSAVGSRCSAQPQSRDGGGCGPTHSGPESELGESLQLRDLSSGEAGSGRASTLDALPLLQGSSSASPHLSSLVAPGWSHRPPPTALTSSSWSTLSW